MRSASQDAIDALKQPLGPSDDFLTLADVLRQDFPFPHFQDKRFVGVAASIVELGRHRGCPPPEIDGRQ